MCARDVLASLVSYRREVFIECVGDFGGVGVGFAAVLDSPWKDSLGSVCV